MTLPLHLGNFKEIQVGRHWECEAIDVDPNSEPICFIQCGSSRPLVGAFNFRYTRVGGRNSRPFQIVADREDVAEISRFFNRILEAFPSQIGGSDTKIRLYGFSRGAACIYHTLEHWPWKIIRSCGLVAPYFITSVGRKKTGRENRFLEDFSRNNAAWYNMPLSRPDIPLDIAVGIRDE